MRSGIAAALALVAGALTWRLLTAPLGQPRQPLPVIATIPQFALTASSGQPLLSKDIDGHVWIADFIFTSCAGTCPLMSAQMKKLQDTALKESPVKFVSFTVDPQNDTPAVLRGYARGWKAQADRWLFVTGEKKQLHALAQQGFKLAVTEDQSADGPFTHSEKFALIDRKLRVRGYFDGTDPAQIPRLQAAVQQLLEE